MKLMIIGGTFNPIHNGHIRAAQVLQSRYRPDRLLLIPTNIPPHKQLSTNAADAADRLAMVQAAIAGQPGMEASDMELRRSGPSYTVDTLRELKKKTPDAELLFVMGTDMLLSLERWREYETIMKLSRIICAPREKRVSAALKQQVCRLREEYRATIDLVEVDPVEISSTEIRKMVATGGPYQNFVPPAVADYIKTHKIYQSEE